MFITLLCLGFLSCEDNGLIDPPIRILSDVFNDFDISWSPDGQWIAYMHGKAETDALTDTSGLYIIDPTGNNKRLIHEGTVFDPNWSGDSEMLVFRANSGDLFKISVTSLELTQITNFGSAFFPSWSSDNSKIVFDTPFNDPDDTNVLWTINPDGSGLTDISEHGIGEMTDPDWSPDMSNIVYVGKHSGSNSEIWTINTTDLSRTRLTNNNVPDRSPVWSPDGEKIAWYVVTGVSDSLGIWIMNADGSGQQHLIKGFEPSWSSDSQKIAYNYAAPSGFDNVLWIIDITTKQISQVTR